MGKKSELLSKLILTKLRSIRKEKFGPKSIDKFSLTIRVFLLRYLNLNYEFTLDELVDELNKRKISKKLSKRIIAILNLITEVKYENKNLSKEEFISLLEETESIINLATGKTEKKNEKDEENINEGLFFNILHKVGAVKTKEEKEASKRLKNIEEIKIVDEENKKELERKKAVKQKEKFSNQNEIDKKKLEEIMNQRKLKKAKILQPIPSLERNIDKIQLIKKKVYEGKEMLRERNLDNAKRIYVEIIRIYISLNPEKQAEVYSDIIELYNERKNKERVKIV